MRGTVLVVAMAIAGCTTAPAPVPPQPWSAMEAHAMVAAMFPGDVASIQGFADADGLAEEWAFLLQGNESLLVAASRTAVTVEPAGPAATTLPLPLLDSTDAAEAAHSRSRWADVAGDDILFSLLTLGRPVWMLLSCPDDGPCPVQYVDAADGWAYLGAPFEAVGASEHGSSDVLVATPVTYTFTLEGEHDVLAVAATGQPGASVQAAAVRVEVSGPQQGSFDVRAMPGALEAGHVVMHGPPGDYEVRFTVTEGVAAQLHVSWCTSGGEATGAVACNFLPLWWVGPAG